MHPERVHVRLALQAGGTGPSLAGGAGGEGQRMEVSTRDQQGGGADTVRAQHYNLSHTLTVVPPSGTSKPDRCLLLNVNMCAMRRALLNLQFTDLNGYILPVFWGMYSWCWAAGCWWMVWAASAQSLPRRAEGASLTAWSCSSGRAPRGCRTAHLLTCSTPSPPSTGARPLSLAVLPSGKEGMPAMLLLPSRSELTCICLTLAKAQVLLANCALPVLRQACVVSHVYFAQQHVRRCAGALVLGNKHLCNGLCTGGGGCSTSGRCSQRGTA